jgi:hypothetical protein
VPPVLNKLKISYSPSVSKMVPMDFFYANQSIQILECSCQAPRNPTTTHPLNSGKCGAETKTQAVLRESCVSIQLYFSFFYFRKKIHFYRLKQHHEKETFVGFIASSYILLWNGI